MRCFGSPTRPRRILTSSVRRRTQPPSAAWTRPPRRASQSFGGCPERAASPVSSIEGNPLGEMGDFQSLGDLDSAGEGLLLAAGAAVGEEAIMAVSVPAKAAVGDLESQVLENPQERVVFWNETLLALDPDSDFPFIFLEE